MTAQAEVCVKNISKDVGESLAPNINVYLQPPTGGPGPVEVIIPNADSTFLLPDVQTSFVVKVPDAEDKIDYYFNVNSKVNMNVAYSYFQEDQAYFSQWTVTINPTPEQMANIPTDVNVGLGTTEPD